MILAAFLLAIFSALVAAQSPILVQVGAHGLTYTPSTIQATNGTIVSFQIAGTEYNHSVTQTTFAAPCTHLTGGFNSAPLPIGSFFNLTVTDDSKPIWFYCNVAKHCGIGMVGAINPPTTGNTFDAFHTAARALGDSEPAQPDATVVVSSGVGAAVASPSGTSTSASSTNPSGSISPSGSASQTATSPASSGTSSAPSSTSTPSSGVTQLFFSAGEALVAGAVAAAVIAVAA